MKIFLVALILPSVALAQMVGGISDTTVPLNYEPVIFATKAINEQLAASNGGVSPNLAAVEVIKARTQVVAGQNLFLTLRMTGDLICDVTVWYRVWLEGPERTIVTSGPTCTAHHTQGVRNIEGIRLGGESQPMALPVDDGTTESADIYKALNFAVCATNARINDMFAHVLGDLSASTYTKQVTAGFTYRFHNVQLVHSNCRNNGCDVVDLANCPPRNDGLTMTCNYTIQEQAWMTPPYVMINTSC